MAKAGTSIVTGEFSDASDHDIWLFDGFQVAVFALIQCHYKAGGANEVLTFTLQGSLNWIEATYAVDSDVIATSGSTGTPTPSVAFALDGSNRMVLRVNAGAANTCEWVAHITWATSDD